MNIIDIDHFTKKYGKFAAVEDLCVSIKKGKIIGFVGKNGAGKSTTMRAIVNVIFPTEGSITVDGMDSVKEAKKIKHSLSYMSGDAQFYDNVSSMNLFKLCIGFSAENKEKITWLAEYFELDTEKRISELSLGNRKKVSVIQALLKDSDIMIMDEPTSGLDPLMQEKFFKLILKEKEKGMTVFLSSHNLNEIEKYCDEVFIIKDGRIIDFIDMSSVKHKGKQVISYTTKENVSRSFEFEGDINKVIADLAKLDLESIKIQPKTLEEEFAEYYKEGNADE